MRFKVKVSVFLDLRNFQSVALLDEPVCTEKRVELSIASVGVAKERKVAKGKGTTSRKGEQKKEGDGGETNGAHRAMGCFLGEMKECSDQGRETLDSPAGRIGAGG